MAKIQTSASVPVSSHEDARTKIQQQVGNMGAKLQSDSPMEIVLKRGSQAKTRLLGGLLGGFFIKDTDLPIIASITFDASKPKEVLVVVSEHLVIGTTLGMRDKYQRACTDFAQAIANVVR